ncbi:MAG: DUF2809 domain-containing protein [Candidatus Cloacimonetes bacterium]|nr:DUF2809 domain-containing protein [Candidatus Cloacimonadota bacterium]
MGETAETKGSLVIKHRWEYFPALIALIALGIFFKYYNGILQEFINNSLAGLVYVIFWCVFFRMIFLKTQSWKITVSVTITTCLLEFLQLWHPPFLEYLRHFWLGKALLGTTFNRSDFIWYFTGGFLFYISARFGDLFFTNKQT